MSGIQPGVPSWHQPPEPVWPAKASVDAPGPVPGVLSLDCANKNGRAKMQTATKNSLLTIENSSRQNFGIRCFPNYPKLYQQLALSLIANRKDQQVLRCLGKKLVAIGQHAYSIRDTETLREAASLLSTLPDHGHRTTGLYYRGLCALRDEECPEARRLFSQVIECGSPTDRAKAFVSLGR